MRPARYRNIRPPDALAYRAGHAWEQVILPVRAREAAIVYSPANLAPVLSSRNVVVIHDVAALRHPQAYSTSYVAYQRRMLPLIARRARLVVTVSEFSRGELSDVLALDPARITVASGGVDERFGPAVDPEAVLRRYGLRRPYVLAVGTASARKNLSVLPPVSRALADDGVDVVQAGSDRGYLRGAAGEDTAVRRLGYVAEGDLPALYAGARAFVMPSLHEGFGLPCLEAMASGVPVVAARSGALPETCAEAATLVPPDDPGAIIEALRTVLVAGQARQARIDAGLQRAAQFPWSRTAALTDAALSGLLAEP